MKPFRPIIVKLMIALFLVFIPLTAAKVSVVTADDFIITVKTDNAGTSTSTQFTIPTVQQGIVIGG